MPKHWKRPKKPKAINEHCVVPVESDRTTPRRVGYNHTQKIWIQPHPEESDTTIVGHTSASSANS